MENFEIGAFKSLPIISLILPYYDYSYNSVKMLKELNSISRQLWVENKLAVSKMWIKQTLEIHNKIDEHTIKALKRGDKYMLFKFIINTEFRNPCKMIIWLLDAFPLIEIEKIKLYPNNKLIDAIANHPIFRENKEYLNRVLSFEYSMVEDWMERPYTSQFYWWTRKNKELTAKYCMDFNYIDIHDIDKDTSIDWMAKKISLESKYVNDLIESKAISKEFYDYVKII